MDKVTNDTSTESQCKSRNILLVGAQPEDPLNGGGVCYGLRFRHVIVLGVQLQSVNLKFLKSVIYTSNGYNSCHSFFQFLFSFTGIRLFINIYSLQ